MNELIIIDTDILIDVARQVDVAIDFRYCNEFAATISAEPQLGNT
jgi:hypothetical protein